MQVLLTNQRSRYDITWLHVTNYLHHGFPDLNSYTISRFAFDCLRLSCPDPEIL
jgi:hypothetical protein